MRTFIVRSLDGNEYKVKAASEQAARRQVMIERWGSAPDAVVPHAPNYSGYGLRVTEEDVN